jgi:large subunit ribosomal protein L1
MAKHGKKYYKAREGISKEQVYPIEKGVIKLKESAHVAFDESVDVDVNVGIDPAKGDQVVRGSVLLPHGIGRKVSVIVFAKGEYADKAVKAGADYVGAEDLIEKIEAGWMDFSYAVATPDLMGLVGKVAKQLGPRGLLPNKKTGTVTFDVANTVEDLKKGRLFFKNDKNGIVHFTVGKISFPAEKLHENIVAFVKALASSKPASSKGKFLKRMTVTSTMGPGLRINPDEV